VKPRVLIVEDEPVLVLTLTDRLTAEGYEVESAETGDAGYARALEGSFDLILLDVALPGRGGFDVLRDLRQQRVDTPVLMLTARGQVVDRVLGLKLGADDYLPKPFSLRELAARVRALLRRVQWERGVPGGIYRDSRMEIDPARFRVVWHGAEVHLTRREFDVLWNLVSLQGRVASREQILDAVWGLATDVDPRTVDAHIRTLRRKLAEDVIETLIGSGYRFRGQP